MKKFNLTIARTILSFSFFMILFAGSTIEVQAQCTIVIDDLIGKTQQPTTPIFQSQIQRPTNSPILSTRPLITKVKVHDSKGAEVYTQQIPGAPSITIPALPSGTYMAVVTTTVGVFHVQIHMP